MTTLLMNISRATHDEPDAAEPAVTVVHQYQGMGVRTALLGRVVEAARERGIRRFRCDFLADNEKVRALLDEFDNHIVINQDHGVVTIKFPLPALSRDDHPRTTLQESSLYRALARAAEGLPALTLDNVGGGTSRRW